MFPALADHPADVRLLAHILFPPKESIDKTDGSALIDYYTLARFENQEKQTRHLNYNATPFLRGFELRHFPNGGLVIGGYSHKGKARTARIVGPPELLAMVEREATNGEAGNLVWLHDGMPVNTDSAAKVRQTLVDSLHVARPENPHSRAVMDYMNALPSHYFRDALDANWQHATDTLAELHAAGAIGNNAMLQQKRILRAVRCQPVPVYAPSNKSARQWGQGDNITGLKREVRKALCRGWWEADLANAQAAIVATTWNIPAVRDFLEAGNSLWAELADFMDAPVDEVKHDLKPWLYSLLYGKSVQNLMGELAEIAARFPRAAGLLYHPIIVALLDARNRMMGEAMAREKGISATRARKARSKLACDAQGVEMEIVSAAVEVVKDTDDCAIVLWQHDGFAVAFNRNADLWKGRIVDAVNERAKAKGIVTRLEGKEL
jgi:tRNA U34 5-methylaminomethyl-2-thiouridine-forming methyltransferase MnmC